MENLVVVTPIDKNALEILRKAKSMGLINQIDLLAVNPDIPAFTLVVSEVQARYERAIENNKSDFAMIEAVLGAAAITDKVMLNNNSPSAPLRFANENHAIVFTSRKDIRGAKTPEQLQQDINRQFPSPASLTSSEGVKLEKKSATVFKQEKTTGFFPKSEQASDIPHKDNTKGGPNLSGRGHR
jgi:hypothetical protein